jgi:hypothetical protein
MYYYVILSYQIKIIFLLLIKTKQNKKISLIIKEIKRMIVPSSNIIKEKRIEPDANNNKLFISFLTSSMAASIAETGITNLIIITLFFNQNSKFNLKKQTKKSLIH